MSTNMDRIILIGNASVVMSIAVVVVRVKLRSKTYYMIVVEAEFRSSFSIKHLTIS